MKIFNEVIDGERCTVNVVENHHDASEFMEWLSRQSLVAVDTETSGLEIFSPGFELYCVQFGSADTAYVLDGRQWARTLEIALASTAKFVMHNATFDMLVIDQTLGYRMENFEGRVLDTRILAHLLDPRSEGEGGAPGHSLKRLASIWVDSSAPDSQQALKDRFREMRVSVAEGFASIARNDDVLLRYAGIDVLLTVRLHTVLSKMVSNAGFAGLADFEHRLQYICALLQRKGMKLDVTYTEKLKNDLAVESEEFQAVAARFGVTNINSIAQVAEALDGFGESLTELTPSGKTKVDRAVLLPLADLDRDWNRIGAREPNLLADAILRSKRAQKWGEAYAQSFLDLRDGEDRLHAWINSLQARTARMSVSRPPLQQLPSSDWTVRRCFIADPGYSMFSVDYSQIEMRVLAGLSGDRAMIDGIVSGVDLHDYTASLMFGPDFTQKDRKLAKNVGFGKVYGGGAATLSRQSGAPIESVKSAIKAYNSAYPGISRYSRNLQSTAERLREVTTASGRVLPVDADRAYASTNYAVQSVARDLLGQSIVNLFDAGFGEYMLLPIHDEILGQAPVGEVDGIVRDMKAEMERFDFMDIPMTADAEIIGSTWAYGYGFEGEIANV